MLDNKHRSAWKATLVPNLPIGRDIKWNRETQLTILGVAIAGVAVPVAALSMPAWFQIALLVILVFGCVVLVARTVTTLITLAIILYLLASSAVSRDLPILGVVARPSALVLLLAVAFSCSRTRRTERVLWSFLPPVIAVWLYSGITSGFTMTWAIDFCGLLAVCAVLLIVSARIDPMFLLKALSWAIFFVLSVSVVLGAVGAFGAFRGSRLAGMFTNANTMGFVAAMGLALAFFLSAGRVKWLLGLLSVAVLVLTASRTSLLAVCIAVALTAVHAVIRRDENRRRIVASVLALSGIGFLVLQRSADTDVGILRTNNSRESGFDFAFRAAEVHPFVGVGYTNSFVEVASTPLRWLAEAGWPGFIGVVISYLLIFWAVRRDRWPVFFVAMFGITHSLFEGWFLSGGSSLFFTYWVAIMAARATLSDPVRPPKGHSPADSDARPLGSGRRAL